MPSACQTACVPRYEIRATADVDPGVSVDVADLRLLTGGEVLRPSAGVLTIVVTRRTDDPVGCAHDVVQQLRPVSRCGVWTARRKGVTPRLRRVSGGWGRAYPGDGDDGLGGVREPRRPLPPDGHLAAELEPPG